MKATGASGDNRDDSDLYPSITVSRGILPYPWMPESWRRKHTRCKQSGAT